MEAEFKKYLDQVASIEMTARSIRLNSKTELENIVQNHEILAAQGLERHSKSLHNFSFRDLETGQPIFYQFSERDFEQRKLDLILRVNQSYCWLFAEGFEYFEDFIELVFAHIGHKDFDKWPTKLRKNTGVTIATNEPFSWFLQQSQSHRELKAKLQSVRQRFPELGIVEQKNFWAIDLKFAMSLVEKLRHVIVHNGGKIKDVEAFIEGIFQASGAAKSGKGSKTRMALVKSYISPGPDGFRVVMLDASQIGTSYFLARLTPITDWLPGYCHYVYTKLLKPAYAL